MRRRLQALSIALALALVGALTVPVTAITFGEPDGNDHPNVGSIVVNVPELDLELVQFCSGTLISEDVFLTASHCTAPLEGLNDQFPLAEVLVTFDSTISESGTFFTGTLHTNPNFNNFSGKGGASDPGDVAVIVLDESPGIEPAQLPTAGLLDQLSRSHVLKQTMFTAVGYGTVRNTMSGGPAEIQDNLDRNRVDQGFFSLSTAWITLSMVNTPGHQSGGTCFGDSGGPHFVHLNGVETNIVTSVTVTGDAVCKATDKSYRTDTPAARDFLDDFVTLP